jgi:hypothetical protein
MYPTGNPRPDPARLQQDIEYLTRTVEDPQHKPYLKGPLIDSLRALGHEPSDAETAVDRYFKVSIQ